jgi:ubiquitin-like protein Nedd8
MQIKIKTIIGKEVELDVDPEETIEGLKQRIESVELIPPQQQRLVSNGRILMKGDATLSSQNIAHGTVVHMVLALRGG